MKKIIIPILLLLLISAALLYVPIGNNLILKKHTIEFKNIKLNAAYEVLTIDSNCGKLIGNGNGMQYLSAMLIYSDEELKWENNDWEGVFLVHVNDTSFNDLMNRYRYESSFKNIEAIIRQNVSFHKDEAGNPIYWNTFVYGC